MPYTISPPSAVMMPSPILGQTVSQMELNEPVSGAGITSTVGGTVTVVKTVDPMLADPYTYTIDSVTCDNIGEMVNGGADLIITKTANSFTFKSSFLDLFDRQYKYTKTFEPLEGSWKQINLVNPKFTTNGTTLVTVTIDNALPIRVGDEVTVANGVTEAQKALKGIWKVITVGSLPANKAPLENEAFTTFTIRINKPLTANSTISSGYNTFHNASRARYVVKGLDSAVKIDDFHGVYELRYPPEARLITFTIKIKKTGAGTPLYETVKWSFKYFSNFNQTMRLLDLAVERGQEAQQSKSVYGTVAPQGFVSLDDSGIMSDSITISVNGVPTYQG